MELSIVVVSWNCRELLKQCLDSVFASRVDFSYEVILVDNASVDDTAAMVSSLYPQVKLIQSDQNLGFAKANNLAFRNSTGRLVLLLNPDAILTDAGTLNALVDTLRRLDGFGGLGCRLTFPDGAHQVGDAGYRPRPLRILAHALGLAWLMPGLVRGLFITGTTRRDRELLEVDWICGACFLVRREVIDRVGGLDERFFLYGEDLEWGCRMREMGYRLAYIPGMSVVHVQSGTQFKQEKEVSTRWLDSLAILYLDMNAGRFWRMFKIAMAFGFLLRGGAYFALFIIGGRPEKKNKARAMVQYGRHVLRLSQIALGPAASRA